jgi:hypothetical protein
MYFRIKDLAVTVLPQGDKQTLAGCIWATRICIRPTIHCPFATCFGFTCLGPTCYHYTPCWHFTPCRHFTPCWQFTPCRFHTICPGGFSAIACEAATEPVFEGCPGGSVIQDPGHPGVIPEVFVIREIQDINVLREQLKEVVAQLDTLEKKGLDAGVYSEEQLADLESRLKEALEEIQKSKRKK